MERDFFTFCTSLKPVELKALGQLSRVRHLREAEVVYSPGDPSDALYIINRGVVEVNHTRAHREQACTYLSRGDIFGDLEVLTGHPRTQLVRSREPVSLQSFPSKDFPDLIKRVPTFFHYLCERLADRLVQVQDLAISRSHCLELSGSLANFDLVTIYQTIANSSQTGELHIMDQSGDAVSAFFFDQGQPRRANFQHLTGEEAFWQLFLEEDLAGTFSFSSGKESASHSVQTGEIEGNPSDMLIHALQFRDEFVALRREIPENTMLIRREKLNFAWPENSHPELEPIAEEIWQIAYSVPITLSRLYEKCAVCQLKIYQIVSTLLRTEHFSLTPLNAAEASAAMVA